MSDFDLPPLGPPCASCGQRISGQSRVVACLTRNNLHAEPVALTPSEATNEPCGCVVQLDATR